MGRVLLYREMAQKSVHYYYYCTSIGQQEEDENTEDDEWRTTECASQRYVFSYTRKKKNPFSSFVH